MITITKPTVLIDESRAKSNIATMVKKCKYNRVVFRPHFKTHQSKDIARWFRDFGIDKITVSSVSMAYYFYEDGWDDILIAFPINILQWDRIEKLAQKAKLKLLVSDLSSLEFILVRAKHPVAVYIELDTGGERSGFGLNSDVDFNGIISMVSHHPALTFEGFYSHSGQTYACRSGMEVLNKYYGIQKAIGEFKKRLALHHVPFTIGDTPTSSIVAHFDHINQLTPGNFVFYDLMQFYIGSCQEGQIAICVKCPVVAKYPDRGEVIIYGGAVHFSKDCINIGGAYCYGQVASNIDDGYGWGELLPNIFLVKLSQEHGIIKSNDKTWLDLVKVGDIINIIPVHSCLAIDLSPCIYSLNGNKLEVGKFYYS